MWRPKSVKGTVISLFFPVPEAKLAEATPIIHHSDTSMDGEETILVVEDEDDVSHFLETMLRGHGYHVLCAANSEQAVSLFKEHQGEIQLVFSDVGLPKVDGISLCETLRKLKPDIPLILASGYPTKEFKERLNALGAQAFLSKPFHTNDILQTVRNTLNGSHVLHMTS